MNPSLKLMVNGRDLTSLLEGRISSLTITDNAGIDSDSMQLEVVGSDVAKPPRGAYIQCWLGYGPNLVLMGGYHVDEVGLSGTPRKLSITGRAANMAASFKSCKNRVWADIDFHSLVHQIASEHGLKAVVANELGAIRFDQLDQAWESDMSFLTRTAKDYAALVKVVDQRLVVAKKGESKSVSGKALDVIHLGAGAISDFNYTEQDRASFASVIAKYHDTEQGAHETFRAGEGEPVTCIKRPCSSKIEAQKKAEAQLKRLQQSSVSLTITCIGNPYLIAEAPIRIKGYDEEPDGDWVVQQAVHTISSKGYLTRCQCIATQGTLG